MTNNFISHLEQEYQEQKMLFEEQPVILQRFLDGQAQLIAGALIDKSTRARFSLPDRVVALSQDGQSGTVTIPEAMREITVGGLLQRDVRAAVTYRLNELEKSEDQGLALAANLL